jgi:hypothetical protein
MVARIGTPLRAAWTKLPSARRRHLRRREERPPPAWFWDLNMSFPQGFEVAPAKRFEFGSLFNILNARASARSRTNAGRFPGTLSRVGNRTMQLGCVCLRQH